MRWGRTGRSLSTKDRSLSSIFDNKVMTTNPRGTTTTRGNTGQILKHLRDVDKPVACGECRCTIMKKEMWRVLRCTNLLTRHPKYGFNILERKHRLSSMFGLSYGGGRLWFYLSLYLLEAGFYLPPHYFVMDLCPWISFMHLVGLNVYLASSHQWTRGSINTLRNDEEEINLLAF